MALRYRNDHVIRSLREAYLLKCHSDMVLLDDSLEISSERDPGDIEADIAHLGLKVRPDTSSDHGPATFAESIKSGTQSSSRESDEYADDDVDDDPALADTVTAFEGPAPVDMKQLGLSLDDDSDFEDDILRAAHEIKLSVNPPSIQRSSSRRSLKAFLPASQATPEPEPFAKREIPAKSSSSHLTSQLTAATSEPREQYLEAVAGINASNKPGLKLKIHIPSVEPITVIVKSDCNAHLTLGYALLKANVEPGDANMYNLHLAEDDGQPDEDFPALERSRPVASYQAFELAVVRATDAEFRENSKRTPNKVPFRKAGQSSRPGPQAPAMQPFSRPGPTTVPGTAQTATSSGPFPSSLSGSKQESLTVKVFMHPYDPLLSEPFWTDSMAPRQGRLREVFEQMCREKMMDTDMFVLRSVDASHAIVDMTASLSRFVPPPESAEPAQDSQDGVVVSFEVIARRNLAGPMGARPRTSSSAQSWVTPISTELSPKKAKKKPSNDILKSSVIPMQPLGFYKYPVLRRQQMNFLGRSERELVIDGEYIHIMPPTDWSIVDQPKTTTFHIRQVIRVKQSRKVPTNFSIIIMKSSGPKRYDLESKNPDTTIEIVETVAHLQRLKSRRPISAA